MISAREKVKQSKGGGQGQKGQVLKRADRRGPSEEMTFQQRLKQVRNWASNTSTWHIIGA